MCPLPSNTIVCGSFASPVMIVLIAMITGITDVPSSWRAFAMVFGDFTRAWREVRDGATEDVLGTVRTDRRGRAKKTLRAGSGRSLSGALLEICEPGSADPVLEGQVPGDDSGMPWFDGTYRVGTVSTDLEASVQVFFVRRGRVVGETAVKLEAARLRHAQPMRLRRLFDRRGLQLQAAAGGAVGLGQHQRHVEARCDQGTKRHRGELGRAGERDAQRGHRLTAGASKPGAAVRRATS